MQTQGLASNVLRAADYRLRAHRLRDHRTQFAPEQVDAFLEHAREMFRSDPDQSRQCARLARYIARKLEDAEAHARCLRVLTQACMLLGRYPEALRAVDHALVLLRLRGDRRERAELQSMRVEVLTQLERWPEAREVGLRALATFEALDHTKGLIRIRMALADLATQLDQPREALRHYRQVEWLLPANAPRRVRAVIATNRGSALQACNRFRAATRWFELARELFLEEGCEHSTAHLDYNLAHAAFKRGRFAEALERFDDIAPTLERLQDEMHRAHVDLDRAEIHLRLHLPEDARAYAERAGERFDALGLTRDRAQAAYVAGRASALGGEYHAATELFARARKAFGALAMSGREVSCLVQAAYAWLAMERPAKAAALAREAACLLTAFSNPLTAASVRLLEASLAMASGDHETARETAAGVLESTRRIFAPWLHFEALRTVGEACRALDRAPEALEALRSALAIVERTRGEVPPDAYRSAYSRAGADLYETLVDLLLDSGDVQGAYEHAQRAKSRTLLEQIDSTRPVSRNTLCDTRIEALRASLNAVYSELLRDGVRDDGAPEQRLARNRQAAELEQKLERLLRQRRGTPVEDPAAASLPSVAAIQAALGPDTRLLEYFQTPRGLVVFVVTAEDLEAVRAPAAPGEVEEGIQRLRFHLAKHERPELVAEDLVLRATRENLARLGALLLGPVADHIEGTRLVIGAHDRLHGVPFHAIPWKDGWLGEHFEIVYVPSGAVLARCAARGAAASGPAGVFAVPGEDVPHIEDEARAVAALLGTDLLHLGPDATLAALRREAASAHILHIATHGMFRRASPSLSALQLGDGWVSHHDLETLRIDAELVVLSTCESGVAAVGPGHEIVGVARGLFQAGARALLCSQWRVRDEVASAFMRAFYGALRDGLDAAAAHRRAMDTIRASHPHPYYWAPFFLLGRPAHLPPAPLPVSPGNQR